MTGTASSAVLSTAAVAGAPLFATVLARREAGLAGLTPLDINAPKAVLAPVSTRALVFSEAVIACQLGMRLRMALPACCHAWALNNEAVPLASVPPVPPVAAAASPAGVAMKLGMETARL